MSYTCTVRQYMWSGFTTILQFKVVLLTVAAFCWLYSVSIFCSLWFVSSSNSWIFCVCCFCISNFSCSKSATLSFNCYSKKWKLFLQSFITFHNDFIHNDLMQALVKSWSVVCSRLSVKGKMKGSKKNGPVIFSPDTLIFCSLALPL